MTEIPVENIPFLSVYSLRSKIFLHFGGVLLAILVVVVLSLRQIQHFNQNNTTLNQTIKINQKSIYDLENGVQQTNLFLQNQLIYTEVDTKSQREKIWNTDIKKAEDSLQTHKKDWSNEDTRLKYENILINMRKLRLAQKEVADLIEKEKLDTYFEREKTTEDLLFNSRINSKSIFQEKVVGLINQLKIQFKDLNNLQIQELNEKYRKINLQLVSFWTYELILIISLIGYIAYVSLQLSNHILRRINQMREYVRDFSHGNIPKNIETNKDEIGLIALELIELGGNLSKIKDFAYTVGKGEFETDIEIFQRKGILGESLAQMHNGLMELSKRDSQRNWTNEGIALFGSILREYRNPQSLYDDLISNLVKYVMANQGGIFILNDQNPREFLMELKSVYAYERKRYLTKNILSGQGLIGQAWREKDYIFIEQANEDYIEISSGLGGASPRSLLIMPMINNESVVLGILELASFKIFEEYEIEFIQRIAEMIVSAISSIKNNEKNRLLLEEAQRVTEQMRVQEKEMRKNLRELTTTQEEMRRNQSELDAQTHAVNSTLAMLELDLDDTIMNANALFLEMLGYTLDVLKGQSYQMLTKVEEYQSLDFQRCWTELQQGKSQNREIRLITRYGNELWFNATYTPVKDVSGNYYKIIQFAIEITEQKRIFQNSKNQLEAINKSNIFIEFNVHGVILEANDVYLKLLGYRIEEIKNKHHSLILDEEARNSPATKDFWQRLAKGEFISGVFKRITKEGKEVWIRGNYNPIPDLNGNIYKIINLAQDITHEKEIEIQSIQNIELLDKQSQELTKAYQRLQEQEILLQSQMEKIDELRNKTGNIQSDIHNQISAINHSLALVEMDMNGTILTANDLFLNMTKYRLSELKGASHHILVERQELDSLTYENFWSDLQQGIMQTKEIKRVAKDGSALWLNASYTPIKDRRGNLQKIIWIALPVKKVVGVGV